MENITNLIILTTSVSFVTSMFILTAAYVVMKKLGSRNQLRQPNDGQREKPEADLNLKKFEERWSKEAKVRQALLYGSTAPLRVVQTSYDSALRSTLATYKSTVAKIDAERDAEYRAAEAARDAEYNAAANARDAEYNAAEQARDSAYVLADTRHDDAARSKAFNEYDRRYSAAFNEYDRRYSAAFNEHDHRYSAAFNEHDHRWSKAYNDQQHAENIAATKREEAVQAYIANHPEEVKKILGAAIELAMAPEQLSSYSSVQILSVPALVETATEIVNGRRSSTDEQVAAVAANLRNYLSTNPDEDPNVELRERARKLLRELIKRLN